MNIQKTCNRLYNNDLVGIALAESAARYMNPFVPFKMGNLSQTYTTKPFRVTYLMPYAHRQYTGDDFNFNKEHHPNATAHWDRAMMRANGAQFVQEAEQIIKRGGGGNN